MDDDTQEAGRAPLSPDRVLAGAVELADAIGIDALTIRKLADALGTKPMSIYHHLPNKEAILDGMVDRVFGEIELPPTELDWRAAMVVRCRSAREALKRHPWATPLMESRANPGEATLRHHDAVLACFLEAGFSLAMTGHAYSLLDSYVYGFALQEAALPATGGSEMEALVASMAARLEPYPSLAAFTRGHVLKPGYDYAAEFEFGLSIVLDGLAASAESAAGQAE